MISSGRISAVLTCFLAIVIGGSMGCPTRAHGQVKGSPAPFTLQKNGGISIQDVLKLTKRPAGRDRITDEALEKIKSDNPTRYDLGFEKTADQTMPPRGDLYANAQILGTGGTHTIVPPSAILFVPESLKQCLLDAPSGKLLLWPEFLKHNGAWIQSREVTLSVARGEEPLPDSTRNAISKSAAITIAVYRGFPISVLPKPVVAPPTPNSAEAAVSVSTSNR